MRTFCPVRRWPEEPDYFLSCCVCGSALATFTRGDTIVDAGGDPFHAYYCKAHAPKPAEYADYANAYAHAYMMADAWQRTVCVVRNPRDGSYSWATIGQLWAPKDWPTNPDAYPNVKHIVTTCHYPRVGLPS